MVLTSSSMRKASVAPDRLPPWSMRYGRIVRLSISATALRLGAGGSFDASSVSICCAAVRRMPFRVLPSCSDLLATSSSIRVGVCISRGIRLV